MKNVKRIIGIVLFALALSFSYFSISLATKVSHPCKYKINFHAPLNEPACNVEGGNCCGDF